MPSRPRADHSRKHFPGPPQWLEPEETRTVAGLIQRRPTAVEPHAKARDIELLASNLEIQHFPVVDDLGRVVGMVCGCDLREADRDTEVMDRMSFPPVTIDGASPLRQAAEVMRLLDIGALPVLVESRLAGVVTWGDLRRAGVVSENDQPSCVVCGGHHHVRIDARTGLAVCVDCQERARHREAGLFDDGVTGGD